MLTGGLWSDFGQRPCPCWRDIGALPTAERARIGLVRTFQRPAPITDLSCIEGVMLGGLVRGLSIAEARREADSKLELLGLADVAGQPPRKLPTGRLKLLDFARVLMLHPTLVLLDELMASACRPASLDTVLRAIEALADEGVHFVVIEHLMDVIKRLSRHLIVMDAGRIVAAGGTGRGDPRSAGRHGVSRRGRPPEDGNARGERRQHRL